MSKKCGKCSKTVYPTEELKCLDKVWHKACFKCQVCSMTLNMKNYKGYDKLPYCNAHYPQTKHTAVADTPESRRIAENTKIQSNIKYHENFEKEKGKKMSVADDPETQRLKKNMQVVSNVAYHNTLQEKARMEQNRPNEETDNFAEQNHQPRRQIGSIADYDPIPNQIIAGQPSGYQSVPSQQPRSPAMFAPTPYSPPGQFSSVQRQIGSVNFNPMPNSNPASSSQFSSQPQVRPGQGSMYTPFRPVQVVEDKPDVKEEQPVPQPYSDQTQEGPPEVVGEGFRTSYPTGIPSSPTVVEDKPDVKEEQPVPQPYSDQTQEGPPEVVGEGFRTTYPTGIPSSPTGSPEDTRFSSQSISHTPQSYEEDVSGGTFHTSYSVATPDLVEDDNVSRGFSPSVDVSQPPVEEPSAVGAGFRTTYQVDKEAPQPPKQNKGIVSQALYDYAAADTDEVSFMENDVIINCEPVDDGWMYGTVERTSKRGMLPSNYVQRIN
ncbi:LIM and SH3 domain protein F42H10.3-like isoform X5 [Haliotis rubra]|uniref:LIM and SH3 domain protein F42H10.3-like isoform X5 n=1 Tax=Haliotis rubra TaxID=36100 RepID=UPI001EE591B4|nr:LIM and SH3 domain protein F42H10.3-like isoform X5 [Haliotis rubra]